MLRANDYCQHTPERWLLPKRRAVCLALPFLLLGFTTAARAAEPEPQSTAKPPSLQFGVSGVFRRRPDNSFQLEKASTADLLKVFQSLADIKAVMVPGEESKPCGIDEVCIKDRTTDSGARGLIEVTLERHRRGNDKITVWLSLQPISTSEGEPLGLGASKSNLGSAASSGVLPPDQPADLCRDAELSHEDGDCRKFIVDSAKTWFKDKREKLAQGPISPVSMTKADTPISRLSLPTESPMHSPQLPPPPAAAAFQPPVSLAPPPVSLAPPSPAPPPPLLLPPQPLPTPAPVLPPARSKPDREEKKQFWHKVYLGTCIGGSILMAGGGTSMIVFGSIYGTNDAKREALPPAPDGTHLVNVTDASRLLNGVWAGAAIFGVGAVATGIGCYYLQK